MSAQAKLLVGLLGIGLLTWLWLQPFGQARTIADDLENRATAALAAENAENVAIAVPRSPVRRTVELGGDIANAQRAEIREAMLGLDGVANALWVEPDVAEAERSAAADAEAATECRNELNQIIASHTIRFRSGSPYINPASARLLDRIAGTATNCGGVRIEIAGHSDSRGSPNVNREMSAFRATAVRDALIERGVSADMLTTIGKGSSEPLGDNPADPANRRIEFTVSPVGEGDS